MKRRRVRFKKGMQIEIVILEICILKFYFYFKFQKFGIIFEVGRGGDKVKFCFNWVQQKGEDSELNEIDLQKK